MSGTETQLSTRHSSTSWTQGQLAETAEAELFMSALEGTRLAKLTEFGRTVHAEMAALLDAARRGAAVAGHQLFTTTFPCHNCARHIIGAGIKRFVGVGPPQYLGLFTMRKRKEADGSKFDWAETSAVPHLITTDTAYLTNEDDFLDEFHDAIQSVDLAKGDNNGDTQRLARA